MFNKRLFSFLMVLMMLFTSFAVSQPAGAAPAEKKIQRQPIRLDAPRVQGEIVVVMANTKGKSLPAVVAQAFATADRKRAQLTRLTGNGAMVLKVNDGQLAATLDELNHDPDILYAEPNYTYSVPETSADTGDGYRINSEYVLRSVQPSAASNWSAHKLVSIADLRAMKTMKGSKVLATYPNDPGVFQNYGWSVVGADIVWPNTTASPGVCVVDTGVDAAHKDLAGRLLPGYDYVWGDATPQDDHGHGTHVTGIITAIQNNALGMAGASNAKVAPIKVLDAQGVGTNFDIAAGITNCANRSDIKVINLSLGGPATSITLETALTTAVTKNKLIIVAAGNNGSSTPTYPAGYANTTTYPQYANMVLAVAASGKNTVDPIDYDLPYPATNYGSWISVVAPGGSIYSTTPWDKSFYLNTYAGVETRFGTLSGTSMAAPFVSAAAARYWGYKPTSTNAQIGVALENPANGTGLTTGAGAWDVSMAGKVQINIAKLLERGALNAGVVDATIGTALTGATISAYQGAASRGSAVIGSLSAFTDIINLPVPGATYTLKVNKAGYTASAQNAFQHESPLTIIAGTWIDTSDTPAAVPPKSANFTAVLVWRTWQPFDGPTQLEPIDPNRGLDLDMDVWLPNSPNPVIGTDQIAKFIVGNESYQYAAFGDPYGAMTVFPFARLVREGGFTDNTPAETVAIRNRFAPYGSVKTNAALPYYPDVYSIYATDYGQTIDHDNDGCGDNYGTQPGFAYDVAYDPTADPNCPPTSPSHTLGIPIMGTYITPYVYVWKDGVMTKFADGSNGGSYWPPQTTSTPPPDNCNDHWWKALTITSALTGTAPTYEDNLVITNPGGECDNGASTNYYPYLFLPEAGRGGTN